MHNGTYTGEFKQYLIEYMHREHLSANQTAVIFKIPTEVEVLNWERVYYEEGQEALYIDRHGRNTWSDRISPQISHIPSWLKIYLRFNASMVNFAFHRSSTVLMGISYRLLSVITWRKNYVSILLKLYRLDTQSVGWPFIQIEEPIYKRRFQSNTSSK